MSNYPNPFLGGQKCQTQGEAGKAGGNTKRLQSQELIPCLINILYPFLTNIGIF